MTTGLKTKIKLSTIRHKKDIITDIYKLIREYFGDKRKNLKDVTREDIKDFYNYLLFDAPNKRSKTGIGYTRRYVKDIRALFSQMLIDAVLDKYIIANPCDYVDIPNKEA